jgi:hypothetical protein
MLNLIHNSYNKKRFVINDYEDNLLNKYLEFKLKKNKTSTNSTYLININSNPIIVNSNEAEINYNAQLDLVDIKDVTLTDLVKTGQKVLITKSGESLFESKIKTINSNSLILEDEIPFETFNLENVNIETVNATNTVTSKDTNFETSNVLANMKIIITNNAEEITKTITNVSGNQLTLNSNLDFSTFNFTNDEIEFENGIANIFSENADFVTNLVEAGQKVKITKTGQSNFLSEVLTVTDENNIVLNDNLDYSTFKLEQTDAEFDHTSLGNENLITCLTAAFQTNLVQVGQKIKVSKNGETDFYSTISEIVSETQIKTTDNLTLSAINPDFASIKIYENANIEIYEEVSCRIYDSANIKVYDCDVKTNYSPKIYADSENSFIVELSKDDFKNEENDFIIFPTSELKNEKYFAGFSISESKSDEEYRIESEIIDVVIKNSI